MIAEEQLRSGVRHLVDAVEPVTVAEVEALVATRPAAARPAIRPAPTARRWGLAAAAAISAVVVVGAFLAMRGDEGAVTTDGTPTTAAPPGPTVPNPLAPLGDDPLVTCSDTGGPSFRLSALDGPTGVENGDQASSVALREHLDLMDLSGQLNGFDPLDPGPDSGFRRLAQSSATVVFGAGELPLMTMVTMELQDGLWRPASSGGGCSPMYLAPPEGHSPARWVLGASPRPDPGDTELRLFVGEPTACRHEDLDVGDLGGPAVIETPDSVTIRVTIGLPPVHDPNDPACLEQGMDRDVVELDVHLREPLGDRQILDGNQYPPAPILLPEEDPGAGTEPEATPPTLPRLELPGGDLEVLLGIETNDENICDMSDLSTCTQPRYQGPITVSVGGVEATGETNQRGELTVVLPAGIEEFDVVGEGIWCPPVRLDIVYFGGVKQHCTRLDLPHLTVSGTLTSTSGDLTTLSFQRADALWRTFKVPLGGDGSYELTLEAGSWFIRFGTDELTPGGCLIGIRQPVVLEAGADRTIDLDCP